MIKQRVNDIFNLPKFPVKFKFNEIFSQNKEMDVKLQLSFFQPPILEILPILTDFMNKRFYSKEEAIRILEEFHPFVNPLFLPLNPANHGYFEHFQFLDKAQFYLHYSCMVLVHRHQC